eukprot:4988781-Prymnesium_polylepis.2
MKSSAVASLEASSSRARAAKQSAVVSAVKDRRASGSDAARAMAGGDGDDGEVVADGSEWRRRSMMCFGAPYTFCRSLGPRVATGRTRSVADGRCCRQRRYRATTRAP